MTTKDELLHLVDELGEEALWLAADEDEPQTDEELSRVEAGKAELARGDYVTL